MEPASARLMHDTGANVVIADLNSEGGNALAQELGERAYFAQTNVTDESSVQQALHSAVERFGQINGLINCAGIGIAEKVIDRDGNPSPLEHFTRVLYINLIGTFNAIRLAGALMIKNEPAENGERGVIVTPLPSQLSTVR